MNWHPDCCDSGCREQHSSSPWPSHGAAQGSLAGAVSYWLWWMWGLWHCLLWQTKQNKKNCLKDKASRLAQVLALLSWNKSRKSPLCGQLWEDLLPYCTSLELPSLHQLCATRLPHCSTWVQAGFLQFPMTELQRGLDATTEHSVWLPSGSPASVSHSWVTCPLARRSQSSPSNLPGWYKQTCWKGETSASICFQQGFLGIKQSAHSNSLETSLN